MRIQALSTVGDLTFALWALHSASCATVLRSIPSPPCSVSHSYAPNLSALLVAGGCGGALGEDGCGHNKSAGQEGFQTMCSERSFQLCKTL